MPEIILFTPCEFCTHALTIVFSQEATWQYIFLDMQHYPCWFLQRSSQGGLDFLLISSSLNLLFWLLGSVLSAPATNGITVIFIFYNFFKPLRRLNVNMQFSDIPRTCIFIISLFTQVSDFTPPQTMQSAYSKICGQDHKTFVHYRQKCIARCSKDVKKYSFVAENILYQRYCCPHCRVCRNEKRRFSFRNIRHIYCLCVCLLYQQTDKLSIVRINLFRENKLASA